MVAQAALVEIVYNAEVGRLREGVSGLLLALAISSRAD
jgi:hypothetical protein